MDSYGIMLTSAGDVESLFQERLSWVIAILSLVGLVVSGYLARSDFTISGESCPLSGFFQCSIVTSSAFKFQLAWSVLGTAGVLGLVYVELFLIGLAHSIGIAILILILAMWRGGRPLQLGS